VIVLLFLGAALMNAATAAASPVATIVAADQLGPAWGALPNTAAIVGTGLGAIILTRLTSRRGWRFGLVTAYSTAALGGLLAAVFATLRDVGGLTLAMLLIGFGQAAALLSRYAAAEHSASRRGFAIGAIVWSGAIGAVAAPLLLQPLGERGAFLFAGVVSAVAAVGLLRLPVLPRVGVASVRVVSLIRAPSARSALAVMATAQVIMALVMTATPLDMHLHHQSLGSVGLILSSHTLGMFALAPLTGWLLDRIGSGPVMASGVATLAGSAALAASGVVPAGALFLLGVGWNLGFVGGSGRLASRLSTSDQAGVEGAVDAAVWGFAATAGFASTAVLAVGGFGVLALSAGALVVIPAAILAHAARRGDAGGQAIDAAAKPAGAAVPVGACAAPPPGR
jgi:MFS family permease